MVTFKLVHKYYDIGNQVTNNLSDFITMLPQLMFPIRFYTVRQYTDESLSVLQKEIPLCKLTRFVNCVNNYPIDILKIY